MYYFVSNRYFLQDCSFILLSRLSVIHRLVSLLQACATFFTGGLH